MGMGPPRLLRGLFPQLLSVDAWLPCSSRLQLLLSHCHSRLTLRWPSCADAFKLLLALLLVSAALAEVLYIASSSMTPTLRPADRAIAEKITYLFRRPSIGDIVFFRVPTALQNHGINKDVVFIKRILATPGDFIEGPPSYQQYHWKIHDVLYKILHPVTKVKRIDDPKDGKLPDAV